MYILTFPISLCFLILSIISQAQSYHWNGNIMYDLEYQGTDFDAEAASWASSTGLVTSGVLTTQCGSDTLVGGYNIMAGSSSYYFGTWSKTYTGLPSHNTIYFKGKFYMIDQWAVYDDHFHLYFDSYNTVMWWIYSNYANYATADKCGNPSYNDLDPMMVYFTVPHTASSLTFSVANHFDSTLASDKQSVGFRDITMTFALESTIPSASYCGVTSGYPLPDHICACGTGTTMSPANSGICGPCDSSCLTCNGASSSDCTSCTSGEYLANGACSSCYSTCLTCNGGSSTDCTSCPSGQLLSSGSCGTPCTDPSMYYYWNGSCLSTCPYPLKHTVDSAGAKFCSNPCGSTSSDYLFYNQSCLSTCPSPLSAVTNPGVQYCLSPCSSGSFLYENKTCINNCLAPFVKRIEPNAQYCDRPCDPGIYWYKNASCLASCPSPYVQTTYSGILQCLPPCKDSEFFYEFEKECTPQCESPFKIKYSDVIKICYSDIHISLSEATKVQDAAASIQSQGQMASGGMKAAGAMNSNSPSSALLAGLSSMLQYIRYMKINYPPKVQMLFVVSAGNPISLGFDFNIPTSVARKLADNRLPDVFEKYDINSNFVNNLWDFLMTLLIILLIIGALSIVKFVIPQKRYPRIFFVLSKVLGAIKWNVPIMMVCSSSGDIFFYASLQIRTSSLDSFSSIICFCLSLLMMVVVFVILVIGFKILRNFKRRAENQNWAEKWKGYEILYEEYEEKSIWSLSYMILFILRGIIFNLTLSNLFNYPLIQCIIINITNVLMLGYLLYLRPLKNFLNLVQLFVNEGLVNIIGVSIIILAIMDKAGINGESTRVSVGDAIYFVIKIFNTFGLVFMGLGLLAFFVSLYRIWKRMKAKKINSPMKIFKAMVLGEVEKQESVQNLTLDSLKKAKIRKPPRKRSIQLTNPTQANEVIYIEETEMSKVQMVTDLSQSVSGINMTGDLSPTPNFSPIVYTKYQEEVSDLQVTELDTQQSFTKGGRGFEMVEENIPDFRALSLEKSQIMTKEETLGESIETAGTLEMEIMENFSQKKGFGFPRNWRKFKGHRKSKEPTNVGHNQELSEGNLQVKETTVNERIETGASDIQVIEIQNDDDDVKNKSVEFIKNWGRFKGRMRSKRTTNVSLYQDQAMEEIHEATEGKGETRISEIEVIENPQKHNVQNKSVEFIQSWGRFKGRIKSRAPTNLSLQQEQKSQIMEVNENEGVVEEKIDPGNTEVGITEITETPQNDHKGLGFIQD